MSAVITNTTRPIWRRLTNAVRSAWIRRRIAWAEVDMQTEDEHIATAIAQARLAEERQESYARFISGLRRELARIEME
jgi:hypothetical protein